MVSIPPHTSHKLQPLDVSVYRSFKVAFEQTIDTFQKNHPGRRITQFDVARLVCTAYEKSATVKNATSGFRKAGIFPYNRNLFTDSDFAPASVYENAPVNKNDDENVAVTDTEDEIKDSVINSDDAAVAEDINLEQPSTSYIISPKQILPLPKVTPAIKKRKLRSQKSEILTSSPFKAAIEKKNERKKKKPKSDFQQNSKGKENNKHINNETYEYEGKGKGKGKGKEKAESTEKIEEKLQPSQGDVFCLFCGEQYVEPLTEDWLQCPSCCGWAHELCTDIEDGCFLCINCQI